MAWYVQRLVNNCISDIYDVVGYIYIYIYSDSGRIYRFLPNITHVFSAGLEGRLLRVCARDVR